MIATSPPIEIRPMQASDHDGIIALLMLTQRWTADDLFARFFAWKHLDGAFGPSAAWVGLAGDRVVGFRSFVRWEFDHPDGRVRRAVRAVDTATDPDFQRRGIFRNLTTTAIAELAASGVDFIFNTPNDKSRPGYLQLGWEDVGRLPTTVRPTGIGSAIRIARARVPAERWSLPTDAGAPAPVVLEDPRVESLVHACAPPRGLRTRRTVEFLRWRYGFAELAYRAVMLDDDPGRGLAMFRLRRRGSAVEAALCDLLVPAGPSAADAARRLERAVVHGSGADYVIRLDGRAVTRTGFVRLPGQGPMLVWRGLAPTETKPVLDAWELDLGDIELF